MINDNRQYEAFDELLCEVSKNIGLIIKVKPLLDVERGAGDTIVHIAADDELSRYPEIKEILSNHCNTCDSIKSFLVSKINDNLSKLKCLNGQLKTFTETIDSALKSSEYRGKEWRDASSERDIVTGFQQRVNAMRNNLETLQKDVLR